MKRVCVILLGLILICDVVSAGGVSGEIGNKNDAHLKYLITGADFSGDKDGDHKWVGYSSGEPITISGKMIVNVPEGHVSDVKFEGYLGFVGDSKEWKGLSERVEGKTVSESFSITYTPQDHQPYVSGSATLNKCGGVCNRPSVSVIVYPLEAKTFGEVLSEEERLNKKRQEFVDEIRKDIDCSKCEHPVKFASFRGEVEVEPCGGTEEDRMFARMHMKICPGDRIFTSDESGVILQFLDLSTFVMKSNSEIIITEGPKQSSNLDLVAGKIWVNIKRMAQGDSLVIRDTRCITGVEGTTFVLETDENQTRLKTLEGKVSFESTKSGKKIMVTDGQTVTATDEGLTKIQSFDVVKEEAEWENLENNSLCCCFPVLPMVLSLIAAGITKIV